MRSLLTALLMALTMPASAQYNIKRLMEEGRRSLDQGYYVAAMEIFSRITALKPQLYEAWYLMALSKYHLEDYKGADADCSKALALQPYIPDIFELYGMTCIREEKYDSAIVAYTHALEINPDNREYWFNRAYCLYASGNLKEAQQQLSYILKRWSDFAEASALRKEIASGAKPRRRPSASSRTELPRLNSLNRGTWLMQQMPKEEIKNDK